MKILFTKRIIALLLCVLSALLLFSCDYFKIPSESNVPDVSDLSSVSADFTPSSDTSDVISPDASETTSETVQDTIISFLACPDNIVHPSVFYDALERKARADGEQVSYKDLNNGDYDFASIYEYVGTAIKQADISYINNETLFGSNDYSVTGYPRFKSPLAMGETVCDLGFDLINLAHNHMLDAGSDAYLKFTDSFYKSKGINTIGYIPSESAIDDITVIEKSGVKIAFLAYTYSTNGLRLQSSSETVIPYQDDTLITRQVNKAKQVADLVFVSMHWGDENSYTPNSSQKHYADLMCELEVDVVVGMHPHVVQTMETMKSASGHETLVTYSLGNFVSGMVDGKNMLAGMLSLDIVKSGKTSELSIENVQFIPIVTHYTKGESVASNDTGYRNFKIYYLSNYTEELASQHGALKYETSHGYTTLAGGKFTRENLIKTVQKYIPAEFLPNEFAA